MKVKDIERTANVTWSPKDQHPVYLAAGTAAQQLDASFSTTAALEVYSLNITKPTPDTQLVSSVSCTHRFHKLIWSSQGADQQGTIIGGCDGGLIQIYSASKLLKSETALVGEQEKHTGPVHALDFNGFQKNLFATGAGNSEIFIWDLNNTNTPMSPGAKTQPLEDILSVSWNKQVQHILGSAFPSKCVIWDLRKNEPIIKITDTVSRIRWKVVAWHPEVATQLCLASEEDQSPIIQLWDLRFATSPLKTLENHQRGILSIAWCAEDSDLLVSCGKDNRIVCWNPNSGQQNGEVLAEVAKTNQWSFDVVWCPRNPALIASPNFDGHVSIYSLMGGKTQQIQTTDKIADSFPGMDGFVQAPVPHQTSAPISVDLTKPPKWLKRPVGASFGFGGKLISFDHDKHAIAQAAQNAQPGQPTTPVPRLVQVSQVITEPELVRKSAELEGVLDSGNFTEYCSTKSEDMTDQHKKYVWHFLKAQFELNPRTELLNLLGYSIEDINNKLNEHVGAELQSNGDGLSNANRLDDISSDEQFDAISRKESKKNAVSFKIKTSDDTEGLITQALLLNNVEAAVGLCLKAKRFADALIIATTGGDELLARTQHKYLEQSEGYITTLISSVVSEDWGTLIQSCDVGSWKEALAAALTHASDDELPYLCEQLGERLERESADADPKLANDAQLCYICAGSFEKLVTSWSGKATLSSASLQELVELVTFLQKAVERQGRQVQISGALADLLSHYASLLASQGDLATAVSYLGVSNNEKVMSLKDRLYAALGQNPSVVAQDMRQVQRRRSSQRQSFSSYPTTANIFSTSNTSNSFHNQFGVPAQPAAPQQPPAPPQFNTGLPGQTSAAGNQQQPWQLSSGHPQPSLPGQNQPPKTFSPGPPPPSSSGQPARPLSRGSPLGTPAGLPSRKYVLDPSVTSSQYGMPLRNQQPPAVNNFAGTPFMPLPASFPAVNPNPAVNTSSMSAAQVYGNPVGHQVPPADSYGGGGVPLPVETGQLVFNSFDNAPSGWNDPPPLSKPPKSQPKQEMSSADPITHPLYGTAPAQPLPQAYGDPSIQNVSPYGHAPPPPFSHNPPQVYQPPTATNNFTQGFNPGNFNQNAITAQPPKAQDIRGGVGRAETPQSVDKGPIPEEHLVMKTVFDELRNRCSGAANNPQTKRKLDDVGKKLESLYDLLRENKLSPNALASLHQMVQFVQNGDYASGFNLHTQLVSGPDFSLIASFMPGLKVLLQCAIQLQVYIR